MKKGVITYDMENVRTVDKITKFMLEKRLLHYDGHYPISDDKTNKMTGAFICVFGNSLLVRLFECITQYRGKNVNKVTIFY